MTEPSMQQQAEGIADDIERLMRENEYWYLVSRACVAFVVENLGMDTAGTLVEWVLERSLTGFDPAALVTEVLSNRAATDLVDGWRERAKAWADEPSTGEARRERLPGAPEASR